jgi:CRISPR-associated protein Cmr1
MKWKEYKVEIVTHCICAGADQKSAEIRVPSIRGEVRWWFRALGGSKEEEKLLFGGVHGDAKRSSVVFRVENLPPNQEAKNLNDLFGNNQNDPRSYLLWPLRPTRQSDQKRGMFPPGATFDLKYALRSDMSNGRKELLSKLDAALTLWLMLGSLGTRGRRGFGSLALRSDTLAGIGTLEQFRKMLEDNLSVFGQPSIKIMTLSDSQDDAMKALEFLGNWLKKWRAGSKKSGVPSKWGRNDHDAVLNKRGVLYRPVIGLPITQRYQSSGQTIDSNPQTGNRWASPVHLKVLKLGKHYYPLAVFFPEMAMPDGSRIKLFDKRSQSRWDMCVDHDLLRAMMEPEIGSNVLWK